MWQALDDFIKYYNWPIILLVIMYFFRNEIRSLTSKLIANFDRVKTFSAGASGINFELSELVEKQEEIMKGKSDEPTERDVIKTMGLQWSEENKNFSSELWKNGIRVHKFKCNISKNRMNTPYLIVFPSAFSSIMSLNVIGNIEYKILHLNTANFTIEVTSMNGDETEVNFIATGM